jgi:hypothetical protein
VVKTRTLSESLDNEELVIAVLRDESSAVTFGFKNTAMDWLLSDEFDRSISDAPKESEESAPIAAPIACIRRARLKPATAGFDRYVRIRDVVEKMDRDVRVHSSGVSRRAAKKARLRAHRQARVSDVTVGLLRNVGALQASAPVTRPVPVWRPSAESIAMMQAAITGA